ncbi:hypothetical protein RM704_14270 [Streptomyces sp. DSM 3412]|uniref:Uncharacterized protein n=1 Tax=Streptomyces gottesmaniae TaxID=3075518 RepID=A0ABU2YYY6_9ACTN|nr:hypothetical protein [Streptomyces sp. DSM 3412]MDT0568619.1 hypothetical protein [Streptomyces sp. DSM 3412]
MALVQSEPTSPWNARRSEDGAVGVEASGSSPEEPMSRGELINRIYRTVYDVEPVRERMWIAKARLTAAMQSLFEYARYPELSDVAEQGSELTEENVKSILEGAFNGDDRLIEKLVARLAHLAGAPRDARAEEMKKKCLERVEQADTESSLYLETIRHNERATSVE